VRPLAFAWRSLVRQPARATLGVLGVAAVGALLFDMLLLSEGLIASMRDLLDRTGYDVRVTTTAELPRTAPRMRDAVATVDVLQRLPEVRTVIAIRFADVTVAGGEGTEAALGTMQGVAGRARPWSVLRGQDIDADVTQQAVVVNEALASALGVGPGDVITVNPSCDSEAEVLPPARLRITGIAAFPFELTADRTIGAHLAALDLICGGRARGEADMLLVTSAGDADAAATAIRRARPELQAATNAQMLGRIAQGGFTYFRQISAVLTTVTVAFALLLISVLLTVSVNQRLGDIAALRALGFSRRRVVLDILCESSLIVGLGGLLSLPLGLVLASWLDRILKRMPNIPAELHFFVFEPDALVVHAGLLVVTALAAALYPMRIVARLPIAATLRNEIIS
jgi:putative ABC transport system permease protein